MGLDFTAVLKICGVSSAFIQLQTAQQETFALKIKIKIDVVFSLPLLLQRLGTPLWHSGVGHGIVKGSSFTYMQLS